MQDATKFYIGGDWVAAHGTGRMDVENPATEETIAEIALADDADVNRAVAAAKAAFPGWAATPLADRIAALNRLLDLTRARKADIAQAISAEMGAPHDLAHGAQAGVASSHLRGFLKALEDYAWSETLPSGSTLWREPVGVCGLITPWNWPINQITLKVLPALATGCTFVLKPSELTPLSAIVYVELLHEAGFPPGVVNLLHGLGPEAGAALSRHADVDMMSFTGSTRGGTAVSRDAADTVKRVTLELGGKSPNLVFADCGDDLEARVRESVAECFLNTGQSCDAPSRMLVERPVYDRVCDIAAAAAEATRTGDPAQPGDHLGPLVSAPQWERVQGFIRSGLDEGARLLAGGPGKPEGTNRGHFARPTVFGDVAPEMTIWREEIFGPVLSIAPFDDEEDGVAMANDTPYGLAAYIQTGDRDRALRVARGLRAGNIHVNGQSMGSGSPFGGYGLSGNGREGGRYGLDEFVELKGVHLPRAWR